MVKPLNAVLLVLLLAIPSYSWNATGHKAIALIAYGQLTTATRARVDHLLSQDPDYSKWVAGVPTSDRGRAAFLAASVWPDAIKDDPRFHDDNRAATSNIPGLPPGSQARHGGWHYTNLPFSPDGTRTRSNVPFGPSTTEPERISIFLPHGKRRQVIVAEDDSVNCLGEQQTEAAPAELRRITPSANARNFNVTPNIIWDTRQEHRNKGLASNNVQPVKGDLIATKSEKTSG